MRVILLLFAVLAFLATVAFAIYARIKGRGALARRAVRIVGICAAVYMIALLAVSLTSREKTLEIGERKAFCGFYLDCHIGIAVEYARRITGGANDYLVVAVRVSSDARAATIGLDRPHAVLLDERGTVYERNRAIEDSLAADGRPNMPLDSEVAAGSSFVSTLVYDVPRESGPLRLYVTEGFVIDRLVELFLIGDEDSFLHAPTTHALSLSAQN